MVPPHWGFCSSKHKHRMYSCRRKCEGYSLQLLLHMPLFSHPATACLLLTPQGQTLNRPLRLLSPGLFFSSHITLLCQCHLSSSPLFSSHCPPFSLFIFCCKLRAYLQQSAFRAGSVMGTSVFDWCRLFDSLMCRRGRAHLFQTTISPYYY